MNTTLSTVLREEKQAAHVIRGLGTKLKRKKLGRKVQNGGSTSFQKKIIHIRRSEWPID